jgi:magnesium-transporting ATPase (P-type)
MKMNDESSRISNQKMKYFFSYSITDPVPPADNVEFGRNTMCHFLSSFFRSLTRGLIFNVLNFYIINLFSVVTDVQQEKFFNSINQIVINTPSVFVTDTDKQHTIDDIRTTNSYCRILIYFIFLYSVFFYI